MSNQDLIKEHTQEKCKYCDIHNCDGIYVAIDGKTRCEKYEG